MQWGQFNRPVSEHTIFYSYRWVAWAVAGLVIAVPGVLPDRSAFSPLLIWLLVFTGMLNVLATALSRAYMQLVQQRPWLLLADVLVGVLLLWASGGMWLPFLPYALGSLVLPVLLGVQPALVMGLMFVAVDQVALLAMKIEMPLAEVVVRSGLPLVFVGVLLTLVYGGRRLGLVMPDWLAAGKHPGLLPRQSDGIFRREERISARGKRTATGPRRLLEVLNPEPSIATLETHRQPVSSTETQPTLFNSRTTNQSQSGGKPALKPPVDLATALRQAPEHIGIQQTFALHMNLDRPEAASRPLSYARQMVLVKLVHEALRNIQQHAHAHTAWLTLRYEPQIVALTIEDDGLGLLDGTHERPGLHSLRAIHYQLAEMDGVLDVHEGDDGGVVVRGWIPRD